MFLGRSGASNPRYKGPRLYAYERMRFLRYCVANSGELKKALAGVLEEVSLNVFVRTIEALLRMYSIAHKHEVFAIFFFLISSSSLF